MVDFTATQRPMGVQIFGATPASMARAAREVCDRVRPDFLDLNFGCPAHKVIEQNAGSGLLRCTPLLYDLVKAGKISEKDALGKATNPQALEMMFKGIFLDEGRRILS